MAGFEVRDIISNTHISKQNALCEICRLCRYVDHGKFDAETVDSIKIFITVNGMVHENIDFNIKSTSNESS